MKKSNFLSIERIYYLCIQTIGKERNEFFSICFKILALFTVLTILLGFIGVPSYVVASPFYYLILFFGGVRMAANAFPELRNKEKLSFWLMIPGSIFEKYISRLLLSSLGFGILFSLLYFIGVNIGNVINNIFFGTNLNIFMPLKAGRLFNTIITFIILHSIFFTGGLFFKRYPIIKTVLFVSMIMLLFMLCISIISWLIFSYKVSFNIQNYPFLSNYWVVSVSLFYKITCYCIIPAFCWIIGYLRLKDVEVR